jgi:uncharacterized protein YlaN (UPF0358 family)
MDLLLRNGDDEMSAQEYVERAEEDFLVIKPDAVDYDKIMALIDLQLRALILFTETVLDSQIMQIVQRLKLNEIFNIRINPIETLSGCGKCILNIVNSRKNPCVHQPDFHLIHSFCPWSSPGIC